MTHEELVEQVAAEMQRACIEALEAGFDGDKAREIAAREAIRITGEACAEILFDINSHSPVDILNSQSIIKSLTQGNTP